MSQFMQNGPETGFNKLVKAGGITLLGEDINGVSRATLSGVNPAVTSTHGYFL